MGRQLRDVAPEIELGIVHMHRDDLVVRAFLVLHGDDADGVGPEEAERRDDRLPAQHEHVQRIAVLAVRPGQEAVVGRVMDSGAPDPARAGPSACRSRT